MTDPTGTKDAPTATATVRPLLTTGARLSSIALLVTGCTLTGTAPTYPGPSGAIDVLDALPLVRRPAPDPDYRRAAFGPAWVDTDRDGCSQRRQVLADQVDRSRPFVEVRRGRCARDILSGTWIDPYTGHTITLTDAHDQQQAQRLPVDHI